MTREYRSGSLFFREKDRIWVGTIEAGWTAEGTRRRITVSSKDEEKCKALLKKKRDEIADNGLPVAGVSSKTTVRTFAETWLERRKRDARPKYFAGEQTAVLAWIIPVLGKRRFPDLTPGDIRALVDAVRRPDPDNGFPQGRNSTTARSVQSAFLRCLKAAVADGHVVPARVLATKAPKKAVSSRTNIPLHDCIAILETAAGMTDGSRWAAAFMAGLRQAEALGLTWSCVDFETGTLDISWQLQAIPYDHGCGAPVGRRYPCGRRFGGDCPTRFRRVPDGFELRHLEGAYCLTRPKTEKGKRVIPVVPWLAAGLEGWRRVAPGSTHDLVWPRDDGSPRRTDEDLKEWYALQQRADVTNPKPRAKGAYPDLYVPHEARHSTATLLLESGVDPKVIKAILGHSSIVTSQLYMHTDQTMARAAMERVAARLEIPGLGVGSISHAPD